MGIKVNSFKTEIKHEIYRGELTDLDKLVAEKINRGYKILEVRIISYDPLNKMLTVAYIWKWDKQEASEKQDNSEK